MPRISISQPSFAAGEISPWLTARADLQRYHTALRRCRNMLTTPQGGAQNRPGSRFVGWAKNTNTDYPERLIPFQFSTTQAYIIEAGGGYFRFFKDYGQVFTAPGAKPYELETPYTEEEVWQLTYAQSADILYIAHTNHEPRKLIRNDHNDWQLDVIEFTSPPTGPTNTDPSLMIRNSVSVGWRAGMLVGDIGKTVYLTAQGWPTGEGPFSTDTVGLTIRLGKTRLSRTNLPPLANAMFDAAPDGIVWGEGVVTAYTSPTKVTICVTKPILTTNATEKWSIGDWKEAGNYPGCVTFHEQRLCWAGSADKPQTFWSSKSGDFENMDTGADDDAALVFTLASGEVNVIRALSSGDRGVILGTVGGEWLLRGSGEGPITPTNVHVMRHTTHGTGYVRPIKMGPGLMFVQLMGRKLRSLGYTFELDGLRASDITIFSEHITESGIRDMAYQQEPKSIIWCTLFNGDIAALTYEPEHEVFGWHKHETDGLFQSVASIPAPDGTQDDVWLVATRERKAFPDVAYNQAP